MFHLERRSVKHFSRGLMGRIKLMSASALSVPGVQLEGVTKSFSDSVTALDRVDLKIADGEFVAVVGPSGCGKSTMMRLIARLASPTSGNVAVFGDVSDQPPPG